MSIRTKCSNNRAASEKHCLKGVYFRNFGAVITGFMVVALLNLFTPLGFIVQLKAQVHSTPRLAVMMSMAIFIVCLVMTSDYLILRPISEVLRRRRQNKTVPSGLMHYAQRRLLNLPFTFGSIVFLLFVNVPMILVSVYVFFWDMTAQVALLLLFRGIMVGMISSTITFFLLEEYTRSQLIPIFFPTGKLSGISGAFRISILRRIRVLYMAGTSVPMIILVGTLLFTVWGIEESGISAIGLGREILIFTVALCIIFILFALRINFLVGRSILKPVNEMMDLVRKLRSGDYRAVIPVVTNDELGVLGDGLNEMTEGLRERNRLRRSLDLAKEVQQNLLPQKPPAFSGLDIAGKSIYCDETGGDYFDFFKIGDSSDRKPAVIIGDVSDHGISSALLMATARASLRQRSSLSGSVADIVTDVNRQLSMDVDKTGQFMTLFSLIVDRKSDRIVWVRAGHDPALLYDPQSGTTEELAGPGIALGLDGDYTYKENVRNGLTPGLIVFLGTDGVYEAQNATGKMFGKERIRRLISEQSGKSADGILNAVVDELAVFREGVKADDDVAVIVVKIDPV